MWNPGIGPKDALRNERKTQSREVGEYSFDAEIGVVENILNNIGIWL